MALKRKPMIGEVLINGNKLVVVAGFRADQPNICLLEPPNERVDPLDCCFIWQFETDGKERSLNTHFSHAWRMKDGTGLINLEDG